MDNRRSEWLLWDYNEVFNWETHNHVVDNVVYVFCYVTYNMRITRSELTDWDKLRQFKFTLDVVFLFVDVSVWDRFSVIVHHDWSFVNDSQYQFVHSFKPNVQSLYF